MIEGDTEIFHEKTEKVWRTFQEIETQMRPKFAYGFSWTEEDFELALEKYYEVEKICLEVIKDAL